MLREWVKLMLGFQVSRTSFFRRCKQAYSHGFVINFNFRKPFLVFFTYARVTALVVLATTVLCVLGIGRLAQIGKTIVCSIAVNMVNLLSRKFAGYVKPNKAVSGIQTVINSDTDIASLHKASNFIAHAAFWPRLTPSKNAGIGIVIYKRFQSILRQVIGFHGLHNIKKDEQVQA